MLTTGVLGWGLTTGIMWAFCMAVVRGWDRLPMLLVLALIGFPIGGYFFGVWTWNNNEKQFAERRDETSS